MKQVEHLAEIGIYVYVNAVGKKETVKVASRFNILVDLVQKSLMKTLDSFFWMNFNTPTRGIINQLKELLTYVNKNLFHKLFMYSIV